MGAGLEFREHENRERATAGNAFIRPAPFGPRARPSATEAERQATGTSVRSARVRAVDGPIRPGLPRPAGVRIVRQAERTIAITTAGVAISAGSAIRATTATIEEVSRDARGRRPRRPPPATDRPGECHRQGRSARQPDQAAPGHRHRLIHAEFISATNQGDRGRTGQAKRQGSPSRAESAAELAEGMCHRHDQGDLPEVSSHGCRSCPVAHPRSTTRGVARRVGRPASSQGVTRAVHRSPSRTRADSSISLSWSIGWWFRKNERISETRIIR